MPRITLKDVAKVSGVSFSLVSKVLRDESNKSISPEKALLIRENALNMGYVTNKQARQLKTGKSMTIAVVIPFGERFETTLYPVLMDGIMKVSSSAECKYDFIFFITYNGIKEYENLKEIIAINPDGIIYAVPPKAVGSSADLDRQRLLKNVADSGKPILFCMEKYNIANTCSFLFNDVAGGYEGTKYLINKGCRRILFCRSFFDERMGGYIQAMIESSLSYNGLITDRLDFTYDNGYKFFTDFFKNAQLADLPDAIMGTCDINTIGILRAMEECGYSQNDIMVLGYDGLDVSKLSGKSFPSILQPAQQIGYDSANTIIQWIESGVMPDNKAYMPQIKIL